ncbi:MAG: RimK family alpha-L-glutamate ligase [Desulfobacterales bacterium]
MILSYHPCFVGDENRLCAGRQPDQTDLDVISRADALILPQGTPRRLYEMGRQTCPSVFPNYDMRFKYPDKSGQIRLFRKIGAKHPQTRIFESISQYPHNGGRPNLPPEFSYPCIFKFDWGGESDSIILLKAPEDLADVLKKAAQYEKTGQRRFLLQTFIPSASRSLRVVVIDRKMVSYWKTQENPESVFAGVSKGARIDAASDPDLQALGKAAVEAVCRRTGIDLAGFDLLFPSNVSKPQPFFLEINYFFGRKGLGGSEQFYQLLTREIYHWLDRNLKKYEQIRKFR